MADSNITKKALSSAMKALMEKKSFSKINIGEICALCGMNRKSFYYHFKDKYDLVNWIFYNDFVKEIVKKPDMEGWEFIENICGYFEQNRSFYVNALEVTGQNSFRDYFRQLLQPLIQQYLKELFSDHENNASFFSVFFTDAVLLAIERWLMETHDVSAEDFVKLLKTSSASVSKKIIEDAEN